MAAVCPVDVTDPVQVDAFARTTHTELGAIDVVVNNAAARSNAAWHELTVEQWDYVQQVNLRGAWLMALAAYPDLRASGYGCVTSVMVETGQVGALDYTASKAGLIGLTRALARELGARASGSTRSCQAPSALSRRSRWNRTRARSSTGSPRCSR